MLRSEHAALQADAVQRRATLETELEHTRDRLRTYEQLEYELDSAILEGGGGNGSGDAQRASSAVANMLGGVPLSSGGDDLVSTLAGALPTKGARRVKQSLQLAQKLLEKHRECEASQRRTAAAEQDAQSARDELAKAHAHLRLVEQVRAACFLYFLRVPRVFLFIAFVAESQLI